MQVAAAALVALAAASAAAGWYVFGVLALGVLFTFGTRQLRPMPNTHRGMPQWLLDGLTVALGIGRVALVATVFAAYLFPAHPVVAGAGLVLVVTVADAVGIHVNSYCRWWLTGILLATLAVFLAVCLAIPPVPAMTAGHGVGDPPDFVAGLRALGLVIVPLSGLRAGTGTRWRRYCPATITVTGVVALAGAAMYQLGPVRFGLSPTSLRAVLVAADARVLLPVLAIAVVVASVPAALDGARQAHIPLGEQSARVRVLASALCGFVAIVLVVMFDPVSVLLICAVLLLGYTLMLAVRVLLGRRSALAAVMILVAGAALLALPPAALLSGLIVAIVGVAGVWLRQRASGNF